MKKVRIAPWFFGGLAVVMATIAIAVTILFLDAPPMLLEKPGAAAQTADAFMSAVCAGDFETARQYLYGTPELGTRQPSQTVGVLIWEALVDSSDYMLQGECYVTDSGLAQDVTFLCLDISSVTEHLGSRAKVLLEERVAQAASATEIYDDENNYREDVVMEVLETVTAQAIREDARYVEQDVTLQLVWQEGQWWIQPEQRLLNALFGGIG